VRVFELPSRLIGTTEVDVVLTVRLFDPVGLDEEMLRFCGRLFTVAVSLLARLRLMFWMPEMVVYCMLALVLAALAVFGVFVLDEKPVDEREEAHRSLAGRIAFLVGSTVLTVGIVVQEVQYEKVDEWLVLALVLMVLSKIATRIYSNAKL